MSDRRRPSHPPPAAGEPRGEEGAPGGTSAEAPADEPVEIEITDVLDLHSFPPREVKALVRDYLDLAADRGLAALRIVHGRGTGVQRRIVRSLLARHPRVVAYGDAPAEAGGWGATRVELRAAPPDGGQAADDPDDGPGDGGPSDGDSGPPDGGAEDEP